MLAKVGARGLYIVHSEREVPRAACVGAVLKEQVQLLIAQLKPKNHKIKRPWLGDFRQTQDIAIKFAAAIQVGNDYRNMVDMRYLKLGHGFPRCRG
jgi:hypothetical protein